MKAFKKKDLASLRAAIKGFEIESRRIRTKDISPKKGLEKYNGWRKKRMLGSKARLYLLAYAFLLGKNRKQVENNTASYYQYSWGWSSISKDMISIIKVHAYLPYNFDEKKIANWLAGEENDTFVIPKKPDQEQNKV